jgi:hypothetical protein
LGLFVGRRHQAPRWRRHDLRREVAIASLVKLREMFVKRHGPQDWLHPEVTEWPGSASAQAVNQPSHSHPAGPMVTPTASEAVLIAKDTNAAERFATRRAV